jgi:hypothetical protein
VVDAYLELDLAKVWGDASAVAVAPYQQENVRRFGDFVYDLTAPLETIEARSHPEGVLAGRPRSSHSAKTASAPSHRDRSPYWVMQVVRSVRLAGRRPRAVRAIGLEHQQRGRAVDRVGED